MHKNNFLTTAITKALNVVRSTVHRVIKQYQALGNESPKNRSTKNCYYFRKYLEDPKTNYLKFDTMRNIAKLIAINKRSV